MEKLVRFHVFESNLGFEEKAINSRKVRMIMYLKLNTPKRMVIREGESEKLG